MKHSTRKKYWLTVYRGDWKRSRTNQPSIRLTDVGEFVQIQPACLISLQTGASYGSRRRGLVEARQSVAVPLYMNITDTDVRVITDISSESPIG